jgi:nucleotide-binding universal stress UspA family protein
MTVPTILWPTDLSRTSLKAHRYVENLARDYQAKVVLFYVGMEFSHTYGHEQDETGHELSQRVAEWELELARKELRRLCDESLEGCPYVEVKTAVGDPVQEILRAIEEEDVDLVVMPAKGRSRDSKMEDYLGSVAERVIGRSPVPVYVINPDQE